MSVLGKILAFLNVLAAIGFICVAAMAYGKRQSWSHAVLRGDLMIHGLPLDAKEVDPEGQVLVDRVGEETQRQLFAQAGGTPVATQEAEVERVRGRVNSFIGSAGTPPQQLGQLARILMPFAETNSQREGLFALFFWLGSPQNEKVLTERVTRASNEAEQKFRQAPPPGRPKPTFADLFHDALAAQGGEPVGPIEPAFVKAFTAGAQKPAAQALSEALEELRADLDGQLKALFAEALSGQRRTANKGRGVDPGERRRAVARLLLNLLDAVPEQQAAPQGQPQGLADAPNTRRFLTVVGLREAVQAVDAQAQTLAQIGEELAAERSRDMSQFAKAYTAELGGVRQRAQEVADHAADLQRKNEQTAAQDVLVKKRQSEVDSYKSELADSRKQTAARLQELRTMSDALFRERIKLRDATRENQKLEKDLHKLEEGR
jgi:hypothetical protein